MQITNTTGITVSKERQKVTIHFKISYVMSHREAQD
jgi:hypothetical protein